MEPSDDLVCAVNEYRPRASTVDLVQRTSILLLVGISGAGKDSVKAELLKTGRYHRIISHTTRLPRINHDALEQHGVDYHFIDLEQASAMLRRGAYVEAKLYGGNVYGTSVSEIRLANRTRKIAVADVEVQGVAEYKAIDPNIRAIYILPPDFASWQTRFAARYSQVVDLADKERRMRTAARELRHALEADHLQFIVNHTILETAAAIDNLMHGRPAVADGKKAKRIAQTLYAELAALYPDHGPVAATSDNLLRLS
jgi:guanylate kinase